MFSKGMIPYVKYNYFHKEQTRAFRNNPFLQQNLRYDPSADVFTCPAGKSMVPICSQNSKSESGYRAHTRLYQASGCTECPLRKECHNAEGNRIIRVNHRLNEYKVGSINSIFYFLHKAAEPFNCLEQDNLA